jgi:hypothetical protein
MVCGGCYYVQWWGGNTHTHTLCRLWIWLSVDCLVWSEMCLRVSVRNYKNLKGYTFLISKLSPCSECHMPFFLFPSVWLIRRHFGTHCSISPAYKIQMPGNHPKERIEQGFTSKKNEHIPQIKPGGSHISLSHIMQDKRVVQSLHKSTITNSCFQNTGNQHGIDCNPTELRGSWILA